MVENSLDPNGTLPDTLTQRIGVLTRREVEARILTPIIAALGERFGSAGVLEIVKETIVKVAQNQGAELAEALGGCSSEEFMDALVYWQKDGALELELLKQDNGQLDFNVTRCRYAEMYRALGIPELGTLLSCNRDYAFIEGFNQGADLERTHTIMEGDSHCDFRFRFPTD